MKNPRELMTWSLKNGVKLKGLTTKVFAHSGRGVMTTKYIEPKDIMISLPRSFLITFDTIWNIRYLRDAFVVETYVTAKDLVLLFLVMERRKKDSKYRIYLDSVPQSYTTSSYIPKELLHLVPPFIGEEVVNQVHKIERHFQRMNRLQENIFKTCNRIDVSSLLEQCPIQFEEVKWAWNVVNTRSVYFNQNHLKCLNNVSIPRLKEVDFALAPLLDMLNHNSAAQISADFNPATDCYEIRTFDSYKPKDEVFINYGSHDNRTLLCEYGFVLPNNIHANVPIERDLFLKYFLLCRDTKERFSDEALLPLGIKLNKICCSLTGFDWCFINAAHILLKNDDGWNLPRKCKNEPCIIYNKTRQLLFDFLDKYDQYISNLKDIESSETIDVVMQLLRFERKILQENLEKLSSECLI